MPTVRLSLHFRLTDTLMLYSGLQFIIRNFPNIKRSGYA